ncbi:hypothetical protein [Pseudonocardia humida]|uniref:Uncharacterized protein n=1 Tax=Pseudonocardia humida TaxID=2800819 RepID=A0ABT1A9G8_9PSEU|nr:hypothetical protein [Pseudonocardia humida]MCO1659686.1 hypothetical protein [Pseudonocardia humida]
MEFKYPCDYCPDEVEFNEKAGVWVHKKNGVRQCRDGMASTVARPAAPATRTRLPGRRG